MLSLIYRHLAALLSPTEQSLQYQTKGYRRLRNAADRRDDGLRDGLIVGIALSPSYGTASIRRSHNITYAAVAQVDGSSSYRKTMCRLSNPSARHATPPYGTFAEGLFDAPRQAWRRARKRIGLPASSDVANIVAVISDLVTQIARQQSLHVTSDPELDGLSIRHVTVAVPSVVGLYSEDIHDALEYLGLPPVSRESEVDQLSFRAPRSLLTSFTAHGCRDDNATKAVLAVEYTRQSLSVEFDTASGFETHLPGKVLTDFSVGSDRRRDACSAYWQLVASDVRSAVWAYNTSMKPRVDVVILMGEPQGVGDERFRDAVVGVAREFGEPEVIVDDPLYSASKGAAMLAWKKVEEACRSGVDDEEKLVEQP